jgi:hypothetical protein
MLLYIHSYIPLTLSYSSETPTCYQNDLAMRNTQDVTGGKPISVWLQSISGGDVVNPLVAFYDIHGRKGEVLFLFSVPDTTRDCYDGIIGTINIIVFEIFIYIKYHLEQKCALLYSRKRLLINCTKKGYRKKENNKNVVNLVFYLNERENGTKRLNIKLTRCRQNFFWVRSVADFVCYLTKVLISVYIRRRE